jgi:hypothetical protein
MAVQSALFNFQSLLLVILLFICTSTYIHATAPTLIDSRKNGFFSVVWKSARVGERLSPYISVCCLIMAVCAPATKDIPPKLICTDRDHSSWVVREHKEVKGVGNHFGVMGKEHQTAELPSSES